MQAERGRDIGLQLRNLSQAGPREECSMEVERPMVKLGRCSLKGMSQHILQKQSYSNAPWECLFKGSFQWICLRRRNTQCSSKLGLVPSLPDGKRTCALFLSRPYLCVPFFVAVWLNGAVSFVLVNVDGTLLE